MIRFVVDCIFRLGLFASWSPADSTFTIDPFYVV